MSDDRLNNVAVGRLRLLGAETQRALMGSGSLPSDTRLARFGVEADGSCFFHALAASRDEEADGVPYRRCTRNNRRRLGHNLRRRVLSTLTRGRWRRFWRRRGDRVPNIQHIRRKVRNTKTWADKNMILWSLHCLDHAALFIDARDRSFYCDVHNSAAHRRFTVVHWNGFHFEPVFLVNGDRVKARSFPWDSPVLAALRRSYNRTCEMSI